MATTARDTRPHQQRDRVVVARDLRGVPEGTPGRVRLANGLTWVRYWVEFDNGEWVGSIDHADLVPEAEWEQFKVRRAEAAEAAASAPAAEATPDPAPAEAAAPTSKVPAHLLERSKRARERRAAAGG